MEPLIPFHVLFALAEEVSVTLPPTQNEVGPLAVIVGVAGEGVTVTTTAVEFGETHPPLVVFT